MSVVTQVVRRGEYIPDNTFSVDPGSDSAYRAEANHLLSSSIPSYREEDRDSQSTAFFKHTKQYPERLRASKQQLNGLRSDIDDLRKHFLVLEQKFHESELKREESELKRKESECVYLTSPLSADSTTVKLEDLSEKFRQIELEREANKMLMLNWETRSRLARALNDDYVFQWNVFGNDGLYCSFRAEGCNYLPYLLSVWAVAYGDAVATPLIVHKEDWEVDRYCGEAEHLEKEGLRESVDSIWASIQDRDRDLMIKLWLTRPNIQRSIAHPMPTVDQGMNAIRNDSRLTAQEAQFLQTFLPTAVDKNNRVLFRMTASE